MWDLWRHVLDDKVTDFINPCVFLSVTLCLDQQPSCSQFDLILSSLWTQQGSFLVLAEVTPRVLERNHLHIPVVTELLINPGVFFLMVLEIRWIYMSSANIYYKDWLNKHAVTGNTPDRTACACTQTVTAPVCEVKRHVTPESLQLQVTTLSDDSCSESCVNVVCL